MSSSAQAPKMGTDLTEGPIFSTLLVFAIPIVLTNLVQQLYSMVDLMVIGHFVGTVGTVAVNTGSEMADLISPIALALAAGGQIYISQLFGAGEYRLVKRTVGTQLSFVTLVSLVFMAVALIFAEPILRLINCPETALSQAAAYMRITAIGYIFTFGYNAVVGLLRGIGESKKPLLFAVVAAAVNIVLDLFLVVVFHMEAAGTAIATVAAQFGAFAAAVVYLWKNRRKFDFEFSLRYFTPDASIVWMLVRLGVPTAFRSMLIRFSLLWVSATANSFGLVLSATNSVGNKLQKFLEVYIQGVDTASSGMVGQNLGAGKIKRAGRVPFEAMKATMACAAIICVLCVVCPKAVFGIFTRDPEVLEMGVTFLHIMMLQVLASGIYCAFQCMVTGSGFALLAMVIGIMDGVVCKIGLIVLFVYGLNLGYIGLFLGNAGSRVVSAALFAAYYFSGDWKTRRLLENSPDKQK